MSPVLINLLYESTLETLYMVAMSTVFGTLVGLPLGVFLATSRRGDPVLPGGERGAGAHRERDPLGAVHHPCRGDHPFTRALVGTSIGTTAAIVPLTIAAVPFIARLVETAIREIDSGLIEAARAMGATSRSSARC